MFDPAPAMLLADPEAWGSSHLPGHRLWQQYRRKRPVQATPRNRLIGSNVAESVNSKAFHHRQRLQALVAGGRSHADWHEPAVGSCDGRRLEWPLFEVQRS
ncbi:MAG: hypothetical protein JHC40_19450 [Burkholderiales bacterium]|nr:hypothetical protein [Burkholderiales bacterium]